jgi:hypothetical protein
VQSKMRIFVTSCSPPTTSDTLTIGTYGQIATSKTHATIGQKLGGMAAKERKERIEEKGGCFSVQVTAAAQTGEIRLNQSKSNQIRPNEPTQPPSLPAGRKARAPLSSLSHAQRHDSTTPLCDPRVLLRPIRFSVPHSFALHSFV